MPQNRSKLGPAPEVMTWRKAALILVVAGLFDLVRLFFQLFWFLGPALAALYCTSVASDWVGSLWGLTAAACAGGASVAGASIIAFTAPIGVIMADAVGFIAFLVLAFWILMTNRRLFSTAATSPFWFAAAFAVGEIPFIGAAPVFTLVLWRLYRAQIRAERAAFDTWQRENEGTQVEERQRRASELMQARTMQIEAAQVQQEAANDEEYAQDGGSNEAQDADDVSQGKEGTREPWRESAGAANDENYIPEKKYGTDN